MLYQEFVNALAFHREDFTAEAPALALAQSGTKPGRPPGVDPGQTFPNICGLSVSAPCGLSDGTRDVAYVQLGSAFPAQPDQNSRSVDPVKGCYFRGNLHGRIGLQTLQRLHKKYSVIRFGFSSFLAVNAFSFRKELIFQGQPSLRAAPRETLADFKKDSVRSGC